MIVQLESDATTDQAARRIYDKHADNSVLVQRDAQGRQTVVAGNADRIGGKTKLEFVGHGADGADGIRRLGGLDASGIAREVVNVRNTGSDEAPVAISKVNVVGCDTGGCANGAGLSGQVGQALSERGIDARTKGYEGRIDLTPDGRKRATEEGGLGPHTPGKTSSAPDAGGDFNTDENAIAHALGVSGFQVELSLRKKRASANEMDQLLTDTEYAAIYDYSMWGSEDIKRFLRGVPSDADEQTRSAGQMRNVIREISNGLDKRRAVRSPAEVEKVYRLAGGQFGGLETGGTFSSPAFLSTSKDQAIHAGLSAEDTNGVGKWVLFTRSGVDISGISEHGEMEAEVLFAPGARFNVLTSGWFGKHRVVALEEQGVEPGAGHLDDRRFIDGLVDEAMRASKTQAPARSSSVDETRRDLNR